MAHAEDGNSVVLRLHELGLSGLDEGTVHRRAVAWRAGVAQLPPGAVAPGPARKYYEITPAGVEELAAGCRQAQAARVGDAAAGLVRGARTLGNGFAVSTGVGWLAVAVNLLAFVAVARPRRAAGRYTSTQPPVRQ